ncbi:hypothetical protein HDU81_006790 [Chytriomyces hyalinus]|nr:hypothetical protein HDU81_006790 [Chytriomyces hyalinus]
MSSRSRSSNQDTTKPETRQFSIPSNNDPTPPPLQQKPFFTTLDWSDTSHAPSESSPPQPTQPTSKLSTEILHKASILRHQFNTLPVIVFNTRHMFQPSNQKPVETDATQIRPPRQATSNLLPRQSRRHKSALSTLTTLMSAGIETATLFPIIVTDPFNLPSSKHATNETFTNDLTTASDVLTMDWILNPVTPPTVHQPQSNFFETMRNLHLFGNVDPEMRGRDRLITFRRKLCSKGFEVGGGGVSHTYSLHRVLYVAPPAPPVQKPVEPVDVWEDPHFVYHRLRHNAPVVPKLELLLKHFTHAPLDGETRVGCKKKGWPHMFYATVAEWLWRQLRGDGAIVGRNGGMRGIGVASDVEQARIGSALRNQRLWQALSHGVSSPQSNVLEKNAAGRLLMLLVERYGMCRRGFWKDCGGVPWLVNTVETLIQTAVRLEGLQHWSTRLEKGLLEEKIRLLYVAGGLLALFLECGKDELNSPLNKSVKDKLVAHVFAGISECCVLAAAMEEICEATVTLVASLVYLLPTQRDQESVPMRDWTMLQNVASKFPSQKGRNTAVFVLRKLNIFDVKAGVNGTWTVARSWQEACQTNKMHPCMLSFNRIDYSH